MTFTDALDRCAELVDFVAEVLKCTAVHQSRLAVHVQFAIGIRNGEHSFLHRGVCDLPFRQNAPRHQRSVEASLEDIRPTRTQQGPIGERTVQTHPV